MPSWLIFYHFFPKTFVNNVIDFLGKASNKKTKKLVEFSTKGAGAELLKGGILGSRIPEISSGKSGHFCKKHKNRQIISYILKKNVPKPPLSSKIGHNRAYIFCMVHDMCIKLVLILWIYCPDISYPKFGSRTFIVLLEALSIRCLLIR